MTPLARILWGKCHGRIEVLHRGSGRKPTLHTLPSSYMGSASYFDCYQVAEAAAALSGQGLVGALAESCFLPAPTTWLEWMGENNTRIALILVQDGDEIEGYQINFQPHLLRPDEKLRCFVIRVGCVEADRLTLRSSDAQAAESLEMACRLLAFVNSPRVIGRRTHMPSASFQRKLSARKGVAGKFPLQAWTELVLEVTPPRDESDRATHDTVLTGERALHFVRAHLRIVRGKLVKVTAHWRGNAANGIKRTRYSVVPPKNGVWPSFSGAQP